MFNLCKKLFGNKDVKYKSHSSEFDGVSDETLKTYTLTIFLNKTPDLRWIKIYNSMHNGNTTFGLGDIADNTIVHGHIMKEYVDDAVKSTKSWIRQSTVKYSEQSH